MAKSTAKSYVRLSSQISQEANDKLTELVEILETTKTAVIERAINELFVKVIRQQKK
jgi:predicted transcriptional regulator